MSNSETIVVTAKYFNPTTKNESERSMTIKPQQTYEFILPSEVSVIFYYVLAKQKFDSALPNIYHEIIIDPEKKKIYHQETELPIIIENYSTVIVNGKRQQVKMNTTSTVWLALLLFFIGFFVVMAITFAIYRAKVGSRGCVFCGKS